MSSIDYKENTVGLSLISYHYLIVKRFITNLLDHKLLLVFCLLLPYIIYLSYLNCFTE